MASGEVNITRDEIFIIGIYSLQLITCTACVCFRYFWYKEVGLYSLQVGRPAIYILKHALHLMIGLFLLPNFFIYSRHDDDNSYHIYDVFRILVTCTEIVCWMFSSLILRFEYRRALGHIWYMHPVFIWVSALVYTIDLVYGFLFTDASEESGTEPWMRKLA